MMKMVVMVVFVVGKLSSVEMFSVMNVVVNIFVM